MNTDTRDAWDVNDLAFADDVQWLLIQRRG